MHVPMSEKNTFKSWLWIVEHIKLTSMGIKNKIDLFINAGINFMILKKKFLLFYWKIRNISLVSNKGEWKFKYQLNLKNIYF